MECFDKVVESAEYKKVHAEFEKMSEQEKFKSSFDKYVSLSSIFSLIIN